MDMVDMLILVSNAAFRNPFCRFNPTKSDLVGHQDPAAHTPKVSTALEHDRTSADGHFGDGAADDRGVSDGAVDGGGTGDAPACTATLVWLLARPPPRDHWSLGIVS